MTTGQTSPQADETAAYVRKVTWVGLVINLLLSAVKFVAGILGSSQAVVADAVHSLTDMSTDVAVLLGSRFWSKPPDEDHPYGHRRIETLVTIFIGLALMTVGFGIGWNSLTPLRVGETKPAPGIIAAFAAALSVVVKEILYRWTTNAGKRVKSAAMTANAWHHRSDAISSLPVLIAVGSAILFPAWNFLDQIAAVVVSIFIIQAALKIIWPGIRELIEEGAPREACERIKTIALENGDVMHVHGIRTRYIGTHIFVDLNIVVDGSITVMQGHDIAENVKQKIVSDESDVVDVVVHVDPFENGITNTEDCV